MFDHLKIAFHWRPELDEFLAPLNIPNAFDPDIRFFSKGIDNTRIDVALSPQFMHHTKMWIRQELARLAVRGGSNDHEENLADLKAAYSGMMIVAIEMAQKSSRPGLITLLHFGVAKFLLQVTREEFVQLRHSREEQTSVGSGVIESEQGRAVVRGEESARYYYQVIRKLFQEILELEETSLAKQRRSVLEIDWPVPSSVLFNPLLQIPSVRADEQWMEHYPLAFNDSEEPQLLDQVNRLVTEIFHAYLPAFAWPPEISSCARGESAAHQGIAAPTRIDESELLGGLQEVTGLLECTLQRDEYEQFRLSWLDTPDNLSKLLKSVKPRWWRRIDFGESTVTSLWDQELWPEFHNQVLKRIFREFRKHHLVHKIAASYTAPGLYRKLDGRLPVRWIYHYLSNTLSRKALLRRLQRDQLVVDVEACMQLLDNAKPGGKHLSSAFQRRQMVRFLVDFLRLRSDLKQAYCAHRLMNSIRVLTRAADIELSRDNATLNAYFLEREQKPEQKRIRSHVVLKADVRGSTEIIRELRKRNLNPASHFSRNFFEPINMLLATYGAKKIFVEGDAVILSLFEYEESKYQWLCVSLACGLASEILKVVDARNLESRENGLPELELGLGIAFAEEAPTFLSDGDREIMISPAINRADQLSSCSALLRKSDFAKDLGRGVEVVAASGLPILEKESSDRLMRYNVNGIELDTPAFMKLESELALRLVRMEESIYPGGARFYVGGYTDLKGRKEWLVVREAPVRVWKGGKPGEGEQFGHRFYQVVTDDDVIARILARLRESANAPPVRPGATTLKKSTLPEELHYDF
ncbi:MAG: hypothetical protein H6965_02320 [Chromatiaceae bacterium]|nr:hypothetical protein [Chromatiaceae bacterium]